MTTYIAKHRIVTTERGQPRTYLPGQPIELNTEKGDGETESEAERMIKKGAVYENDAAYKEAQRAEVEGIKSPMTEEGQLTDAERAQARADAQRADEEERQREARGATGATGRAPPLRPGTTKSIV